MMRPPFALMLVAALVSGCTQFPALDTAVSPEARKAPYPGLVPLEAFDAPAGKTAGAPPAKEAGGDLAKRAAALRARAAAIYGSDDPGGAATR